MLQSTDSTMLRETLGDPADPTQTGHEPTNDVNFMNGNGRRSYNSQYNRNSDLQQNRNGNYNNNPNYQSPSQNTPRYYKPVFCGFHTRDYFCGQFGHMAKDHMIVSRNQYRIAKQLQAYGKQTKRLTEKEYIQQYGSLPRGTTSSYRGRGGRGGRGRYRGSRGDRGGRGGRGGRGRYPYTPRAPRGRDRADRSRRGRDRSQRNNKTTNELSDADRTAMLIVKSDKLHTSTALKNATIDINDISPQTAKELMFSVASEQKWDQKRTET